MFIRNYWHIGTDMLYAIPNETLGSKTIAGSALRRNLSRARVYNYLFSTRTPTRVYRVTVLPAQPWCVVSLPRMLAIINVVLYTVGRGVYARERHAIGIQLRLSNRHRTMRFTKARVFVVTQSIFHSGVVKTVFFANYIENIYRINIWV